MPKTERESSRSTRPRHAAPTLKRGAQDGRPPKVADRPRVARKTPPSKRPLAPFPTGARSCGKSPRLAHLSRPPKWGRDRCAKPMSCPTPVWGAGQLSRPEGVGFSLFFPNSRSGPGLEKTSIFGWKSHPRAGPRRSTVPVPLSSLLGLAHRRDFVPTKLTQRSQLFRDFRAPERRRSGPHSARCFEPRP